MAGSRLGVNLLYTIFGDNILNFYLVGMIIRNISQGYALYQKPICDEIILLNLSK